MGYPPAIVYIAVLVTQFYKFLRTGYIDIFRPANSVAFSFYPITATKPPRLALDLLCSIEEKYTLFSPARPMEAT